MVLNIANFTKKQLQETGRRLLHLSSLRKVVAAFSVHAFSEIVNRVLKLFVVLFLVRHFEPDEFGRYSSLLAILAIGTTCVDFGLKQLLLNRHRVKSEKIFPGLMISTRVFFSAACLGLLLPASFLFSSVWHLSVFGVSTTVLILLFASQDFVAFAASFERSNLRFLTEAALRNCQTGLLLLILAISYLKTEFSLQMLMLCMLAVDILLLTVWLFAQERIRLPVVSYTQLSKRNKVVLSHGKTLLILGFAGMAIYQIDSIFLGFVAPELNADFQVALRLLMLMQLPVTLFLATLVPLIAGDFRPGSKIGGEKFKWFAASAFFLSLICMFMFWSFGAELISVIFGGNYGANSIVNFWLAISIPAIFTYPILIQFLNFKGQSKSVSLILLFAAICNVVLDLIAVYFNTPSSVIIVSCLINFLVLVLLIFASTKHGIFEVTSLSSKSS